MNRKFVEWSCEMRMLQPEIPVYYAEAVKNKSISMDGVRHEPAAKSTCQFDMIDTGDQKS